MRPETGVKVGLAMMVTALLGMIVAGLVTRAQWAQEERRRRTRCGSSLKSIGYALHLYSGDFSEEFPSYGGLPGPGPEAVPAAGDGGAEGRVLTEGAR